MKARAQIKIIKASNKLQMKAGAGDIDKAYIERAEKVIENNTENFSEIGREFLDRLAAGVDRARSTDLPMKDKIAGMTQPVMELKANARMFKYELVSELANVMLGFLESIKELDKDAIEIVAAHHATLSAIITEGRKGDGGESGPMLRKELESACQRYSKKRQ